MALDKLSISVRKIRADPSLVPKSVPHEIITFPKLGWKSLPQDNFQTKLNAFSWLTRYFPFHSLLKTSKHFWAFFNTKYGKSNVSSFHHINIKSFQIFTTCPTNMLAPTILSILILHSHLSFFSLIHSKVYNQKSIHFAKFPTPYSSSSSSPPSSPMYQAFLWNIHPFN